MSNNARLNAVVRKRETSMSTGIGFGSPPVIGLTAPASILVAGFSDDYTPGLTKPDNTSSSDSTIMYIGGGRCDAPTIANQGRAAPNPYTVGFGMGKAFHCRASIPVGFSQSHACMFSSP